MAYLEMIKKAMADLEANDYDHRNKLPRRNSGFYDRFVKLKGHLDKTMLSGNYLVI